MQLPRVLESRSRSAIWAQIRACHIFAARLHSARVGALPDGSRSSATLISLSERPRRRPALMKATRRSMYLAYRRWLPDVRSALIRPRSS